MKLDLQQGPVQIWVDEVGEMLIHSDSLGRLLGHKYSVSRDRIRTDEAGVWFSLDGAIQACSCSSHGCAIAESLVTAVGQMFADDSAGEQSVTFQPPKTESLV